jgi:Flp pilus assembly protein TadB
VDRVLTSHRLSSPVPDPPAEGRSAFRSCRRWAIILRAPRRRAWDASESAEVYARLRLSQLRTSLRDLRFAGAAAGVLFVYAVAANAAVWWLADDRWHEAGMILLVVAGACLLATWVLIVLSRRRVLREYRAVRRLVGT